MAQQRIGAFVIGPYAHLNSQRRQIVSLAERYAISAIAPWSETLGLAKAKAEGKVASRRLIPSR
jgi:hypothetical protein